MGSSRITLGFESYMGSPSHHGCSTPLFCQLAGFLQSACLADWALWWIIPGVGESLSWNFVVSSSLLGAISFVGLGEASTKEHSILVLELEHLSAMFTYVPDCAVPV